MKKIDVLVWGVKHISANHDTHANTDYQEDGAMCIMDNHVPTVSDLRMLCEDLGIEREQIEVDNSWCAVTVYLTRDWHDTIGQEEYIPTGHEMWKRANVNIGE